MFFSVILLYVTGISSESAVSETLSRKTLKGSSLLFALVRECLVGSSSRGEKEQCSSPGLLCD